MMIGGTAGNGRSRLLDELCRRAASTGVGVLRAAGGRPTDVLEQLLRKARSDPGLAARLEPAPPGASPADLLVALTVDQPLLIAVDDVHRAEPASVAFLASLAQRIESTRVLLAMTSPALERTHPGPEEAGLAAITVCTRIWARPLSQAGVHAYLTTHLSERAGRALAEDWSQMTGGNLALVHALLEDYRAAAPRTPRLVVGEAFTRTFLFGLHRGDPAMLPVKQGVAVLGDNATPVLLAGLVGVEKVAAQRATRRLHASGLLNGRRFRHAGLRRAVLDDMAPDACTALLVRAAELLHQDGAPVADVAANLLTAGVAPAGWGVPVLRDAATQALDNSQVTSAIRCLRLAMGQCADGERDAIRAQLARAEWRLDPGIAARHLDELVAAVCAGRLAGRDTTDVIDWLQWFGRMEDARRVMEHIAADPEIDDETRAALCISQLRLSRMFPPLARSVAALGGPRIPAAITPTVDADVLAGGMLLDVLRGDVSNAISVAERLLYEYQLNEHTWSPLKSALTALIYCGRVATAAEWAEKLGREARERNAPAWQVAFGLAGTEAAVRQGDLAQARQEAYAVLRIMPRESLGVVIGGPLSVLIRAATTMGDFADAIEWLRTPVPASLFDTSYGLRYLEARATCYLAIGNLTTALRDFETCGELMRRWQIDFPGPVLWRIGAAQALIGLGKPKRARRLLQEQLHQLTPEHHRVRGIALRVLAATAPADRQLSLLNEAARELQRSGDRLELAHTLADLGRAYETTGQSATHGEMLARHARHLAEECGVSSLGEAAGGASPPPDSRAAAGAEVLDRIYALTDAERRVAALAADGLSNRQIANRLFVTESTVEQHLTKVYRKLAVAHRKDLPPAVYFAAGKEGGEHYDLSYQVPG